MKSLALLAPFVVLLVLEAFSSCRASGDYDSIFTKANFSGVSAAWNEQAVLAGTPLWKRAFGFLDWQFDVPMPQDARFPIASNTKLYVAVSLYQLQEQGKVDLNKNVADYLDKSDFEAFGHPGMTKYCPYLSSNPGTCLNQTFVQLLAMTGGISNEGQQYLPFPGSIGNVVGRYIKNPLLFTPGEKYYYSNPSFMLGAYFIEKLSGMSFQNYLKKNIFDPVGIQHTYYDQQDEMFTLDPKRVSEFHRYIDPTTLESVSIGKCTSELQLGSANGAGGIVGNPDDEAKWYFTLFNFTGNLGGNILSSKSVYEIVKARTPGAIPGNSQGYYAQGLFVTTDNPSNAIPQTIQYEGMIQCSWTSNVYDLTKTPVTMGQAYTNTPVFYANGDQVQIARTSQYGSWWSLTANWPQATAASVLAQELIDAVVGKLF